eukprot:6486895-Amphidinium_carterae.1
MAVVDYMRRCNAADVAIGSKMHELLTAHLHLPVPPVIQREMEHSSVAVRAQHQSARVSQADFSFMEKPVMHPAENAPPRETRSAHVATTRRSRVQPAFFLSTIWCASDSCTPSQVTLCCLHLKRDGSICES